MEKLSFYRQSGKMAPQLIVNLIAILSVVIGSNSCGGPLVPFDYETTPPINGLLSEPLFEGNYQDQASDDLQVLSQHGENQFIVDRFGKGKALKFNVPPFGGAALVVNGPRLQFDHSSEFSLSIWSKTDFSFFDTDFHPIELKTDSGNFMAELTYRGGSYSSGASVGTSPKKNSSLWSAVSRDRWTHYSIIYESRNLALYINGSLASTFKLDPASYLPSSGSLPLGPAIGLKIGSHFSGSYTYRGAVDDIRIYDRAISEDEVLRLYHEGCYRK